MEQTAKGSAFDLEDEGELMHCEQSLSNLDDFDDVGWRVEEDEKGMFSIHRQLSSFFRYHQVKSTRKFAFYRFWT
jgi:hypothetical protein